MKSITYGELPETVQNLIESREWDNKNIDEQREWLIRELHRVAKQSTAYRDQRLHTINWYACNYGKLQDWARKVLPEPWASQLFSCLANGLYDAIEDVGERYQCVAGFEVVPGGYIKFSSAQEQVLNDQTARAEQADLKFIRLRSAALKSCDAFDAQPNHDSPEVKIIMDDLRKACHDKS